VTDRVPVTPEAQRAFAALQRRHADRRPVTGPPIDDDQLRAVTDAVEREGGWLHVLPRDGVIELSSATSSA
jgi:hypothetical protein